MFHCKTNIFNDNQSSCNFILNPQFNKKSMGLMAQLSVGSSIRIKIKVQGRLMSD